MKYLTLTIDYTYNSYLGLICHTCNSVNILQIGKLRLNTRTVETRKGITGCGVENSLYKQIALNKAIYFLPSFNPVNLGTLLSFTRFFRKLSNLVLLYSVIFWPETSTFTLPSFTKNRVATTTRHPLYPPMLCL